MLTTCLAQIAHFEARFASQKRKKARLSIKVFKLQSVENITTAHVPPQFGLGKASALSIILTNHWTLDWTLKRCSPSGAINQSSFDLLLALALHLLCSLPS